MKIFSSLKGIYISIKRIGVVMALGAGMLLVAPEAVAKSPDGKFTVIIDAGHGGHDVGAVDNGVREKDINLGVARRLEEKIRKKMKDVKTVMTRGSDNFISLQERADIANRNRGDLFISIHTNSVDKSNPNRKRVSGASVYALGLHKDANNLQVARRENSVIELESDYKQKYSGFDPSRDESYIIFEMAQKKTLGQSLKFANEAQKQLVSVAGRSDRGVKQAGFWVLWATSMPSVLVELDFICNPTSASYLASDEGQDKLADALFNAVENYVESAERAQAAIEKSKKAPEPAQKEVQSGKRDKKVTQADPVGKKSNKDKKKKKKGGKGVKIEEPVAVEASPEPEEVDETPVVAAPVKERKRMPSEVASAPRQSTLRVGQRKRRSSTARKASEERVLETGDIAVGDENAYLAKAEKRKEKVKEEEPTPSSDQNKDKKGKKNKKDKKKGNKKDNKRETTLAAAPKEEKKNSSSGSLRKGKKSFTVTSTGEVLSKESDGKGNLSIRTEPKKRDDEGHRLKVNHLRTVYKIQILASKDELKGNDPRFCGLKPISCFKENGYYKYTYGESENRREIEEMLSDVKTKIGDAFIIVGKK